MAELKGTNVAAGIVPFTSEDKYATHDAQYGKGGFRSVATIAERDAIPAERKTEGMVVRVQADKKHYVWENNAWTEWLPKGNVTVDTALNINSNNAIANKVVTSSLNAQATKIGEVETTAKNAIPKAKIAAESSNLNSGDTTQVPSSKALSQISTGLAEMVNAGLDRVDTKATDALNKANAAIPKTDIIDAITDDNKTSTTLIPNAKAVNVLVRDNMVDLTETISAVGNIAVQAKATAEAAIPKANIAQTLTGNTTRQDLVPSVKLVNDSIKSAVDNVPQITVDAALNSTSTNPVQNKVIANKITSMELGVQIIKDDLELANAALDDLGTTVGTQTKSIQNISTALSPIKTAWDKKNAANGLVQLDGSAKLPASVLPAGYDNIDMLVAFVTANPTTGMTIGQKWYNTTTKKIFTATSASSGAETTPDGNEKVYINIALNKSYRWTGSDMVVVGDGSGVALGITSTTAFRGDYGNVLYGNFGSGANLINTQKARTYFGNIQDADVVSDLSADASKISVDLSFGVINSITGVKNPSPNSVSIFAASASQAGVMTAAMYQTLQELELQAFPLTLSLSGAGVFEAGQGTKNPINISVTRKGTNVTSSSTVTVTPPSGIAGTLASNKTAWTPTNNITANVTVSVTAAYGAQTQTKSISYTFKYKKYWGVSDKATLTNAEILALAGNGWADARTMGATRFDCSGGKYPYYIIPADKYTGLEVWVGGLKNTDLVVTDINLVNASGATKAYKVVRLANKQTGVLSVEFK